MKNNDSPHCSRCGADLGLGPRLAFPVNGAKAWFCAPCFGPAVEAARGHDGDHPGGRVPIRAGRDESPLDKTMRAVMMDRGDRSAGWAMPTTGRASEAGREFKNQTGGRA